MSKLAALEILSVSSKAEPWSRRRSSQPHERQQRQPPSRERRFVSDKSVCSQRCLDCANAKKAKI